MQYARSRCLDQVDLHKVLLVLSVLAMVVVPPVIAQPAPSELDPLPHYKKGLAFTQNKQYGAALAELDTALELNPSMYEAKSQKAVIYQLIGKNQDATNIYEQLLDIKPNDANVLVNYGTLLKREGHFKQAEDCFRKAIDANYYLLQAHYDLANLLAEIKHIPQAIKEYQVCLKLAPDNAMVHNNLGAIYQKKWYFEEAEEEFRKASHLDPANQTYAKNLRLIKVQLASKHKKKTTIN